MSDTETHLKQHYIGGKWVDSQGGKLHDVINPATEEAASTVVLGSAADVDAAVAAAKEAFKTFSQTTREERLALLNRIVDDYASDQVSSDNLDGGRRVAEYLVACGRKRIALIGGIPRASTIRDRERGFREALDRLGVGLPPHYYCRSENFTHANGEQAVTRLMELASPPDAIFCVNDVLAMGAMDGARARGARGPDDAWIVGYDDIEIASWGAYDLTTVRQPMEQMVAQAIERLLARIDDRDAPVTHHCLANELVIRGSTARCTPPAPVAPRKSRR